MDSGDDRDSMAAGGRSDDELPSDFEAMADDDPGSPERPPFHGGSGSTQALSAQEGFLASESRWGGREWGWGWGWGNRMCGGDGAAGCAMECSVHASLL